MNTKVVLHVLCSGNYSGAEKIALQLIDNYPSNYKGIYFAQHGVIDSVSGIEKEIIVLVNTVSFYELFKVVKLIKPDVIHAHDFRASIYSSLLPRAIRIVSHIHQNPRWFYSLNLQTLLYFFSCTRFRKVVFVGDWYKKSRLYNYFFSGKSVCIENCISVKEIDGKLSTANVIAIDKFDVLFLGRLSPEKDPLRFIYLAAEILKKRPSTTFKLVGDGPIRKQCEMLIEELNVANSVEIVGFTDNPYPYIVAASVLINTSIHEGFGLVAVESLILNRPYLSSGVGGLSSIFSSNKESICFSNEEYIHKCVEMLNDSDVCRRYLIDRDVIVKKFCNIERWVSQFIETYD